jgi:glycosyltransferase involved in cell wall biosynthesis
MPTRGRPQFAELALLCFLAQDWSEKELIILDDADFPSFAKVPDAPQVHYHRTKEKMPVGVKRNRCCELAKGDLIAHLDDDDFSTTGRLADQVHRLEQSGKSVTGYHSMRFKDGERWIQYLGSPATALGASLLYLREWWACHPFAPIDRGEDGQFVREAFDAGQLVVSDAGEMMYATIHPLNTSPRDTKDNNWRAL